MKLSIFSLAATVPVTFAFVPNSVVSNHVSTRGDVLMAERTSDRRTFVSSSVAAGILGTFVFDSSYPLIARADGGAVDYTAVAADIADLIKADPDKGPTLVRLAWHSSGTYDKMSKTGGSGLGTMRFKEEFSHGANAGLADTAIKWMEDIKSKYGDGLSYADLYTLAGAVAIKTLGGPQVAWGSGRKDSMDPADVTPDGRLPAADSGSAGADPTDASHLRTIFGRMGFNDQEIVALSGAHALGRCHTTASGYDGPWTPTPTLFNNAYFTLLTSVEWTPKKWEGPYQYEAANGSIMMLPTDIALVKDKKFAKYVKAYAKDEALFMKDFSAAFSKLLSLGTSGLTPVYA